MKILFDYLVLVQLEVINYIYDNQLNTHHLSVPV